MNDLIKLAAAIELIKYARIQQLQNTLQHNPIITKEFENLKQALVHYLSKKGASPKINKQIQALDPSNKAHADIINAVYSRLMPKHSAVLRNILRNALMY